MLAVNILSVVIFFAAVCKGFDIYLIRQIDGYINKIVKVPTNKYGLTTLNATLKIKKYANKPKIKVNNEAFNLNLLINKFVFDTKESFEDILIL